MKNNANPTPASSAPTNRKYSQDEIAARARALWQERGSPQGQDEEIWLEAERRLNQGNTSSATGSTSAGPSGQGGVKPKSGPTADRGADDRNEARTANGVPAGVKQKATSAFPGKSP